MRVIPVAKGNAIDDPVWAGRNTLFVTLWTHTHPSLAKVNVLARTTATVPTIKLRGCGLTTAQFVTRKGEAEVAYQSDCLRPALWRQRSNDFVTAFGVYDLSGERNRSFGPVRVPLGSTGRFTFSPDGSRAILASGGLYSHLEWLWATKISVIRQGLTSAAAPSWSPDGRLIVFAGIPQPNGSTDIALEPTNLYAFRPDRPRRLHLVIRGLKDFRPYSVGWFPDRSGWFVSALQPLREPAGLWLVDASTGRKALLLKGGDFGAVAVSPDGRTLATSVGGDAEYLKDAHVRAGLVLIRMPQANTLSSLMK